LAKLLGAGTSSIGSNRLIAAFTFGTFILTTGGRFRIGWDTMLRGPPPRA
jgi:hypothetical protein